MCLKNKLAYILNFAYLLCKYAEASSHICLYWWGWRHTAAEMGSISRISKSNNRISPAGSSSWLAAAPAHGEKWHLLRDSRRSTHSWADVWHHPTEETFLFRKNSWRNMQVRFCGAVLAALPVFMATSPKGGWPLTLKQPWEQQMAT